MLAMVGGRRSSLAHVDMALTAMFREDEDTEREREDQGVLTTGPKSVGGGTETADTRQWLRWRVAAVFDAL
jgi:hypothetical protein